MAKCPLVKQNIMTGSLSSPKFTNRLKRLSTHELIFCICRKENYKNKPSLNTLLFFPWKYFPFMSAGQFLLKFCKVTFTCKMHIFVCQKWQVHYFISFLTKNLRTAYIGQLWGILIIVVCLFGIGTVRTAFLTLLYLMFGLFVILQQPKTVHHHTEFIRTSTLLLKTPIK